MVALRWVQLVQDCHSRKQHLDLRKVMLVVLKVHLAKEVAMAHALEMQLAGHIE